MPKILLVEDNEDNSDMLTRRLERRGYEVVLATDGESAIQMAQSISPSLILMDMRLPGIDGWAATAQLKGAPETNTIPIIGLSAHALTADRDKAFEAGCDDYETKPVEFPRLLEKIEAILGK
jgi:two-component system, cell cycle response regulator DivK